MGLIGRNNGRDHRDRLVAVAAIAVRTGNAMLALGNQGLDHIITMFCHDLQGHPVIAGMERCHELGRNKLEDNRVSCIDPALGKTEDNDHAWSI